MNRNVWLLFCCQALMSSIMAGQIVMASLVGHALAVDGLLTTLPVALQMVAMMCASIPASMIFARLGRKPGFWFGCFGLLLGSLIYALGVWKRDFPLYCLGAVPSGLGWGIAQHLRFAASEVAAPDARPRAISLVLTGGVLAAILGPEIVERSDLLIPATQFLGTYLCLTILPVIAAILLYFAELPPAIRQQGRPVPIRAILARPGFVTAVVASMVGYGTMLLVMASTPLEMLMCGFGVDASADVIRMHSIAMYLPGFATGRLIQRFGAHVVITVGGILVLFCAAANLSLGLAFGTFAGALMLLGVGWNFMFIGGTTLLTSAHDSHERVRVQATNDFIVFGTVAVCSLASGAIQAEIGWGALNLAVVPPVLIAVVLVTWHWAARARLAPA